MVKCYVPLKRGNLYSSSTIISIIRNFCTTGRAYHGDNLVIGKIHPSQKCCYVAFAGKEHWYSSYDVLVNEGTYVLMYIIAELLDYSQVNLSDLINHLKSSYFT